MEQSMKTPTYLAAAAVTSALVIGGVAPTAFATTAATAAPAVAAATVPTALSGDPVRAGVATLGTAVPRLTAVQRTQWQQLTATPAGRAWVVTEMQAAFQGLATVGASAPQPSGAVHPNLATGITGDHFWITASYADVMNGAIAVGVRACATRLPGWLCSAAGTLLTNWASGWGAANDHGVWAAIYWAPPHITGGRW
jgi:hypothetical protein